jgi:endo-1,4-beta-xylanase
VTGCRRNRRQIDQERLKMAGRKSLIFAWLLVGAWADYAAAQSINGSALALRSSGTAGGSNWTLNNNGYVGTYVTLDSPADVTISVQASGQPAAGVPPRMNIAVDDVIASFDVAAGFNGYEHTFALPAGTHFVRTDFNNDREKSSRALTIASLIASGAPTANSNSNALAIAAANTYIANHRKGDAHLRLVGVQPGAEVQVTLRNHAFNFGAAAANPSGANNYWSSSPVPGSTADKYQQFVKSHFNMLVPENAGKWSGNESSRDVVNMATNDAIVAFARQNDMRFRQHNLLWSNDAGSPGWVNTLITQALGGSQTAKDDLLAEINERIAYYVGDGVGGERAHDYFELDVLNEGLHESEFRTIFGDAGLASIFNSVAAAASAAGANPKLYVNEYNVLQFSDNPTIGGFAADNYANWFREHGEAIEQAGGQVDGYGVQYYALLDANANTNSPHSAARMQQVFQNLSLTGKPFTLTEFGVQNSGSPSGTAAANALEDAMRMVFGSPNATTFNMWGFWTGAIWDQATFGALVDANWNPTTVGQRYEQLMSEWHTDLMLTTDANGSVDFRGFYGDYDITIDGLTYNLSLLKGQSDYELVVDLAADLNGDLRVDAGDLATWRDNFGTTSLADGDGDGDSDGSDFLIWQRQLGLVASPPTILPTSANIPEPNTLILLACAISCIVSQCQRCNAITCRGI